jgi:hypothetical protein
MPKGSARAQTIRFGKLSACDKFRIQLGCVFELYPLLLLQPFQADCESLQRSAWLKD